MGSLIVMMAFMTKYFSFRFFKTILIIFFNSQDFITFAIMPNIEVCLSPALLHLYDTTDKNVVIIDVFRATSTIAAALHNGAKQIIPVDSVAECIRLGELMTGSITAGERDGMVAEGLQHGNSPTAYPTEFIDGKTLILTTTNGTRLLYMVQNAKLILSGSFLNLGAICSYLAKEQGDVLLACASWKDKFNLEDTLFAGAVAEHLLTQGFTHNCDSVRASKQLWNDAKSNLFEYIKDSSHYLRLSKLGLQDDMEYCCQIDKHNVLPKYLDGKLVC
jgi:2-phosphosulfolactate phosphatase